jgi:hypothetical protein
MNGFCLLAWAMIARRREVSHYLANNWKKVFRAVLAPWARTGWRYGR